MLWPNKIKAEFSLGPEPKIERSQPTEENRIFPSLISRWPWVTSKTHKTFIFSAVPNQNADGNSPEYLFHDGKRFRLYHQQQEGGKDSHNVHHSHPLSFDKSDDEHVGVDDENSEYLWNDGKLYLQDKNFRFLYHGVGPIGTQLYKFDKSISKTQQNIKQFVDKLRKRVKDNGVKRKY